MQNERGQLRLYSKEVLRNEEELLSWLPISTVEDKPFYEGMRYLLHRVRT
jgi:hypothetical protein